MHLADTGKSVEDLAWPCFHTRLYCWRAGSTEYGVVGGTIGAPFAVLVAEELFALGCRALVSISSAGLLTERFTLQPVTAGAFGPLSLPSSLSA